jgi:hypothetical protein
MSNVHPVSSTLAGKAARETAREAVVIARFADLVFLD